MHSLTLYLKHNKKILYFFNLAITSFNTFTNTYFFVEIILVLLAFLDVILKFFILDI